MIEALACGTPVIAWRNGSVPEVIEHGVTGFVVDSLDEAAEAVAKIDTIDRRACRAAFEARFDSARMAHRYVDVYRRLVDGARAPEEAAERSGPRGLVPMIGPERRAASFRISRAAGA